MQNKWGEATQKNKAICPAPPLLLLPPAAREPSPHRVSSLHAHYSDSSVLRMRRNGFHVTDAAVSLYRKFSSSAERGTDFFQLQIPAESS